MRLRPHTRACLSALALIAAPGLAAQLAPNSVASNAPAFTGVEAPGALAGVPLFEPVPAVDGFAPWFADAVDRVMEDAIVRGAAPGAAVVVGHAGRIVLSKGWGHTDPAPGAPAVTEETVWDLASVTKVAGTTIAAMLMVQDGKLDLDAPVHAYLAQWPESGPRSQITARQLLHHNSGLRAGAPGLGKGERGEVTVRLAGVPLVGAPGDRELYGDLDMVLLGAVIESVAGETLDQLLARRVYRPLGMSETAYRPLDAGIPLERIAPTEKVGRTKLHGVVPDPIARDMGGVSGNAGLFASARDLGTLASALLWEAPGRVVCREVVEQFTEPVWGDDFALGWESAVDDTIWGELFSREAYGHTGYTGTSIWIDPELDLFVVLLTNRVNPSARNQKHLALRRELHWAVVRALADKNPAMEAPRDSCFVDRIADGIRNLPPIHWAR